MPEGERRWTFDAVKLALEGAAQSELGPAATPADAEAYLKAAAVMSWYDPRVLRPVGASGRPGDAFAALQRLSRPAPGRLDRHSRRLRSRDRRRGLELLGTRTAMAEAVAVNERHHDPGDNGQRLLNAYLRGTAPALEQQTGEELGCTLQVVKWLRPVLGDVLPRHDEVRRHRDERGLFEPHAARAGEYFAGRERELEWLRGHVGVLSSGSLATSLRRRVRAGEREPISIYGPGGIGKSTLISRFVLEHSALRSPARLPFVYIDFDDS